MAEMSDECSGSSWFGCAVSSKGVVDAWDGKNRMDFEGFFSNAKNMMVLLKDTYFNSAD